MSDYIKKEDAENIMLGSCDESALWKLRHLPSADVVEVRRGKWKEVLAGMDFEYECTRCKACVNQIYPYCPNCGAKMGEWVEVPSHWMIVGSKDGEYFEVKEQDDED